MIDRRLFFLLLLGVAGCSSSVDEDARETADLLLTNARVYTLDWSEAGLDGSLMEDAPHDAMGWRPDAEAVAVRGSEIVFVGSDPEALEWRGEETQVIDLAGATLLPGLVDSHTHIFELGEKIARVNLIGIESEEAAVAMIVERARDLPEGEWIIGWGWDEGAWANNYPDKVLLSDAVPNHPVLMRGRYGFADFVNQRALDETGVTAETPIPVGGEMPLADDGTPSGLFINRAVTMVRSRMPEQSDEELRRLALLGLEQMAADGYVAVHDAGLASHAMAALEQMEADGELPIRVYAMLSLRDEDLIREWIARGPDQDTDSMLVTRSVKAYYDGSLGSRGARLLWDYSDMPGHRGVSGGDYGFDEELMAEAMAAGFQIAIHAIGDAGNREALNILERIMTENPSTAGLRHRIEHAQVLHPDDLPRLAELGIIASMEPPHAVEDKTWAEDRLGPVRILGAYAWRSLREAGTHLTFNSDNPGSAHDIFYGLHSAITRQDRDLEPEGGWYAHEAVNAEEAVRGYTSWSAYANCSDDHTGIIAPGRWADLTVIDVDPFVLADEAPAEILDGQVLMTIVGGDIVYDASASE